MLVHIGPNLYICSLSAPNLPIKTVIYLLCTTCVIPWTQHKTNEWILCKLKVDRELLDRVKSLKLGFYGHTTRKYESLEKEVVQRCVGLPGYRNRGRQRRRWTDDIAEWTGMKINEEATAAGDRDHWRGILRGNNPSYGGRH